MQELDDLKKKAAAAGVHGFSEEETTRKILKTSFCNAIQRRHIKQHQKNIEVFEQ